jgi:hypothetical protein
MSVNERGDGKRAEMTTISWRAAKLAVMLCESMGGCEGCPLSQFDNCVPMTEEKAKMVLDWAVAQEAQDDV